MALASTLDGPRQDFRDVLRLVRAKVRRATGGEQTPWFLDNVTDEIWLDPNPEIFLEEEMRTAIFDVLRTMMLSFTDSDLANYFSRSGDAKSLLARLQESQKFREKRDEAWKQKDGDFSSWEISMPQ